MGAKYYPTVRDLKASQRFLDKQKPAPNFKSAFGTPKNPPLAPAPKKPKA